MIGLYVHIPFCTKKCHYCNFVITTNNALQDHRDFLAALEKEIFHYKNDFAAISFDTLYLGGGTPSVMRRSETADLFRLLKKNFKFKSSAEITCEINPGDIDQEKVKNYFSLGINRISLGAQSFHDETLERINRTHRAKDILSSVKILKDAGFKNISLDLILSLPGETLDDVKNSLDQLIGLAPQHVSLYELTIEERTVFGDLFKKGKLKLPDEDLQIKMLSLARNTLKRAAFFHYELLSYAKPGFESRHNKIYWNNEEYLGLGPGAFSYVKGRRFMFAKSYEEYLKKIEKNDWSAAEEEKLISEKREREAFLLALRLMNGAEIKRFHPLIKQIKDSIDSLKDKDLLCEENGKLRLTDRGQFFAETVFSELSV